MGKRHLHDKIAFSTRKTPRDNAVPLSLVKTCTTKINRMCVLGLENTCFTYNVAFSDLQTHILINLGVPSGKTHKINLGCVFNAENTMSTLNNAFSTWQTHGLGISMCVFQWQTHIRCSIHQSTDIGMPTSEKDFGLYVWCL